MVPWLRKYLTDDGLQTIEEAIITAEKKTRGEIVPMIVRSSSTTGHVPIIIFTLLVLLYYVSGVYDWVHEVWELSWPWTLAWSVSSLVLSFLLAKIPRVQRMFVSAIDREIQARGRAMNEFYEANLHKTEGSTGILLFISLNDHEAVVLADKSISEKISPETWNQVMQLMLQGAKKKDLALGYQQAIEKCGEVLSEHFPILPDDVDELSNHLIIKE